MFEQSKPTFGLVKLTPYHEVHIYTQGKIFVEDDISAYEYSKIRVQKCSALSQHGLILVYIMNACNVLMIPVIYVYIIIAGLNVVNNLNCV
jgi:hypothetical protein